MAERLTCMIARGLPRSGSDRSKIGFKEEKIGNSELSSELKDRMLLGVLGTFLWTESLS